MPRRFEDRLVRLEQRAAAPWKAWEGLPAARWPDEALKARVRDGCGLSPDTELTSELLGSLIAQAREKKANDGPAV